MAIINKLLIKAPREVSGREAQSRFGYQVNFAALLIIQLLEENRNFVALLEYLDDIVILDNVENPEQITFYQVKTNISTEITLTTMISENYIKYMNENVKDFDDENVSSVFVSNTSFKFNTKNARDNKDITFKNYDLLMPFDTFINTSEKKDDLVKVIKNSLENEIDLSKYYIYRTSLPLEQDDVFIKGKLMNYLSSINSKLDIPAINAMYNEFNKKLNDLSKNLYTPIIRIKDELFTSKGFKKEDFNIIKSKVYNYMIPVDPNKIYDFSINILKYKPLDSNVSKFNTRYNKFSVNAIQYHGIHSTIIDVIKSINIDDVDDEKLVEHIIDKCDSDISICNFEFYKSYKDLIVLVFIYKGVE